MAAIEAVVTEVVVTGIVIEALVIDIGDSTVCLCTTLSGCS